MPEVAGEAHLSTFPAFRLRFGVSVPFVSHPIVNCAEPTDVCVTPASKTVTYKKYEPAVVALKCNLSLALLPAAIRKGLAAICASVMPAIGVAPSDEGSSVSVIGPLAVVLPGL